MSTNGFSFKPRQVKLLAGEQVAQPNSFAFFKGHQQENKIQSSPTGRFFIGPEACVGGVTAKNTVCCFHIKSCREIIKLESRFFSRNPPGEWDVYSFFLPPSPARPPPPAISHPARGWNIAPLAQTVNWRPGQNLAMGTLRSPQIEMAVS